MGDETAQAQAPARMDAVPAKMLEGTQMKALARTGGFAIDDHTGDQLIASMVVRSPTWPHRSVPPVLTACWAAGVETVAAPVGAAAVVAAGLAPTAVAAGGGAAGAEVGAAGTAPGPQAASRLAAVAESNMASAPRRLMNLSSWRSGILRSPE